MLAAVHGPAFSRLERYLSWLAAGSARSVIHLPAATAESAAATATVAADLLEAVAAIDGTVTRWLEWDLRLITAVGAGCVKHLTVTFIEHTMVPSHLMINPEGYCLLSLDALI